MSRTPKWARHAHLDEAQAALAKRSLFDFFRLSWEQLEETQTLVLNWHLEAICDHAQASLDDWMKVQKWKAKRERARKERRPFDKPQPEIRMQNQVFNVPPGSSKSRIISVCAPAWMWLHWPSWKGMFLSANPRVALRDAMLSRQLIESDWYRKSFYPDWQLRDDQNAKSLYWTTNNGFRLSAGMNAKVIGERVDCEAIDDPHDPEEVKIDDNRIKTVERFDSSIFNRVSDKKTSLRWIIMQRLHKEDLTGHVLVTGKWKLLCIPQEYEPARVKDNPDLSKNEIPRESAIGFVDPRTKPGALLDPVRSPADALEEEKETLGPFGYAGQHQQNPTPAEGGTWKRHWWGYWVPRGVELLPQMEQRADGSTHVCEQIILPDDFEFTCQSWDMAFGKSQTSSMVVGQIWALNRRNRFLLDQVRDQMDFVETKSAFRTFTQNWPDVERKLVENKANGPAIISELKTEISGILAIEPDGDKVARANAEAPTLESGHVFLPHPGLFKPEIVEQLRETHPQIARMIQRALDSAEARALKKGKDVAKARNWVLEFVEEAANFPKGAFKDIVDTASQALNRIRAYIRDRDALSDIPGSSSGFSI